VVELMTASNEDILRVELERIKEIKSRLGLAHDAVLQDARSLSVSRTDLNHIADNLEVTAPYLFSSHRKLAGPVVAGIKGMLVNRILGPLLRMALGRQWALNHHVYQTAAAVVELDERLKLLEKRIARLEQNRA
jgi:hypothetical protein